MAAAASDIYNHLKMAEERTLDWHAYADDLSEALKAFVQSDGLDALRTQVFGNAELADYVHDWVLEYDTAHSSEVPVYDEDTEYVPPFRDQHPIREPSVAHSLPMEISDADADGSIDGIPMEEEVVAVAAINEDPSVEEEPAETARSLSYDGPDLIRTHYSDDVQAVPATEATVISLEEAEQSMSSPATVVADESI